MGLPNLLYKELIKHLPDMPDSAAEGLAGSGSGAGSGGSGGGGGARSGDAGDGVEAGDGSERGGQAEPLWKTDLEMSNLSMFAPSERLFVTFLSRWYILYFDIYPHADKRDFALSQQAVIAGMRKGAVCVPRVSWVCLVVVLGVLCFVCFVCAA